MKVSLVQDQTIAARTGLIVRSDNFNRLFRGIRFDEIDGDTHFTYAADDMAYLRTGSPGARSSGGCGRARPVVPGGTSLATCRVLTRSSVVTDAANIAMANATANRINAVRWLATAGYRLLPEAPAGKRRTARRSVVGLASGLTPTVAPGSYARRCLS
jgi:hypothetical protein